MTAAPIARVALAYVFGVAAGLLSVPVQVTLLLLFGAVAWPIRTSRRPLTLRAALVMTAAAGAVAGYGSSLKTIVGTSSPACDAAEVLTGRFTAPPLTDRARLVRADGCGALTVVLSPSGPTNFEWSSIAAGRTVRVRGRMRQGRNGPWFSATAIELGTDGGPGPVWQRFRWAAVRFRGELVRRIHHLYGDQAPLVTALTLARTEGLDRHVRDAFAGAGIAHLLAISGFHVGVVAGLVSAVLGRRFWGRRRTRLVAALVTSSYVALIGFPVSACRAALIFVLTSLSVSLGRVPSRWGALGLAALILLWIDPRELSNAGFQLSFAGAAGLVAWARPLEVWLIDRFGGRSVRVPRVLISGVAAGVAATVATLPFVAWHFQRVALLGIPATLVATPLVSLALPGSLLSVALSTVWLDGGAFMAGGVSVLLDALSAVARRSADTPIASAWLSSTSVLAGGAGVLFALWIARRPGVGARGRRRLMLLWVAIGIVGWPVLLGVEGRGSLDLWMIDVGQGDAIAIRSPAGSWMLIDAGPPSEAEIPAQPVVRTLRSLGVSTIDMLVLTHPDADHIGGVPGVLRSFRVRRVLDPSLPVGKQVYADVISAARIEAIPWTSARAGQRLSVDDVTVEVLHPSDSAVAAESRAGPGAEVNRVSVVLRVSWQDIDIVLTGDAYMDVEESLAEELGDIDILKVGHHGSLTSTSPTFLRATRPGHALISSGRSNRYGHPAPLVLSRLSDVGARIHRTDMHGTVKLRVSGDGRVRVDADR